VCPGCREAWIRTGAHTWKHRFEVNIAVKPALLVKFRMSRSDGCCFLLLLQLPIQPVFPRFHLQFQIRKRHFRFVEMWQFAASEVAELLQSNVERNFIDGSW